MGQALPHAESQPWGHHGLSPSPPVQCWAPEAARWWSPGWLFVASAPPVIARSGLGFSRAFSAPSGGTPGWVTEWVTSGAGRRSSGRPCALSWCRSAEQPLPARRQGPRQRQETGCGAELAGDARHPAVTSASPAAAGPGAGPSSRGRWDPRTSAQQPGVTRGRGTVPAPGRSSCSACQLPPLGPAQGSPALA